MSPPRARPWPKPRPLTVTPLDVKLGRVRCLYDVDSEFADASKTIRDEIVQSFRLPPSMLTALGNSQPIIRAKQLRPFDTPGKKILKPQLCPEIGHVPRGAPTGSTGTR